MSSDQTPAYGTADGERSDETFPVYGTPEPPIPARPERPPVTRRRSIVERMRRSIRRLSRPFGHGDDDGGLDWSAYPGLTAGDSPDVLRGIRLDDVLARNDRILSRVRRALEAEFRVHWWANTDSESLETQWNSWGGASLLQTARSATWRTTSGLTSVEDRDMAARVVGVALAHEGFSDQQLLRREDEWLLTARPAEPPESVLTLQLGFSEFELILDSSAVLASENEAEFRLRAARFSRDDA